LSPVSVSFTGVQSRDVWAVWGSVKGFIEAGMDEGESLERIYNQIIEAKAQLWVVYDLESVIGAGVSEIIEMPSRKVLNIFSIGGTRFAEWVHCLDLIEAGARERGCTAMRHSNIRKGFTKLLKGYRVTKVTVEKEIENG